MFARLNRIFLAVLFIFIVAACEDSKVREAEYLDRAKSLIAAQDYVKARIELRNALQINPKSAEALYNMAKVEKASLNIAAAISLYSHALREDPNFIPAIDEIGQLYLAANQQSKTQEQIDRIFALEPQSVAAQLLQAGLHLRRGELDAAARVSQAVLALEPTSRRASIVLAHVQRKNGDLDGALRVLDGATQQNPKVEILYRIKIEMLESSARYEEAETTFAALVALAPNNSAYRTDWAWFYIRQGRLDDAESMLRKVVADFPEDPAVNQLLADFLINRRDQAVAQSSLQDLAKDYPEATIYSMALASLYRQSDQPKNAIAVYEEIITSDSTSPTVRSQAANAVAAIHYSAGNDAEALTRLESVLEEDSTNQVALMTRARVNFRRGLLDLVVADTRTVLRDEPTLREALFLLAQAQQRLGELDLAISALQNLIQADSSDVDARAFLALLLVERGEVDQASPVLDETAVEDAYNPNVLRARTEIYIARRDLKNARSAAGRLSGTPGHEFEGLMLLGKIATAEKKVEEATKFYAKALDLAPDSPTALDGYVQSLLKESRLDDAEAFLTTRLGQSPEDAVAHNQLAMLSYARGQDIELVAARLQRAADLKIDWVRPQRNLAIIYITRGMPTKAIPVLRDALIRRPDDFRLNSLLALAYRDSGDATSAISLYETMMDKDQGNALIFNNLAMLIADHEFKDRGRLERAYQLVAKYQNLKDPLYLDTIGWVQYRLGNATEAIALLERAAELTDDPQLQYHLGLTYLDLGQNERAHESLMKAVSTDKDYTGLKEAREALAAM